MTDLSLPMNPLAFDALVALGRSMIPTLAPRWTDHNPHDPGIMLIELLAWIAEAQMYSLSRMRRDERLAYANLLGVDPQGPQPAMGLLWPPASGAAAWAPGTVLAAGAACAGDVPDVPIFGTCYATQLTTAQLVRVVTVFGDGMSHDWTRVNAQQSSTFMPFGSAPSEPARLVLTFQMNPNEVPSAAPPISLGFEVVNAGSTPADARAVSKALISLADGDGERAIEGIVDTTYGLLRSGVMLLSPGQIVPENGQFRLIVRSAPGGFARSPRLRRIGINVLPVQQVQKAFDERARFGTGLPDQVHNLSNGLMFTAKRDDAVAVRIAESDGWHVWTRTDDLEMSGPSDRHFVLDTDEGTLTFGNGVNGGVVPFGASIQVSYRVSLGSAGNVQQDVNWRVEGVAGTFGTNPDATSGGVDATTLDDLRDKARVNVDTLRPLVTAKDLEDAAAAFVDLGVTRAVELKPDPAQPAGSRTLVVAGPHDEAGTSAIQPEGREFLTAVSARLTPRLPLGQRLRVIRPNYVPIKITATLTSIRNMDPATVRASALEELQTRLAIVTENGLNQWPLGRPVSTRSVQGWLRKAPGVAQVNLVELRMGTSAQVVPTITLGDTELPDLLISATSITVARPAEGSSR